MLKAFKVEVVDLKNNNKAEFFFNTYKWAYMSASKKADEIYFGHTIMYENVGKEEFVEIQRFEKDYNFKKDQEESSDDYYRKVAMKVINDDTAKGQNHEQRWKNAMKNEKVPIIIKKFKNKNKEAR